MKRIKRRARQLKRLTTNLLWSGGMRQFDGLEEIAINGGLYVRRVEGSFFDYDEVR